MGQIKERTTNIVKRLTFDYYSIKDFDNLDKDIFTVEVINNITGQEHVIELPYHMLYNWYDNNNLKYNLLKEYILNKISDDYYPMKENPYEE